MYTMDVILSVYYSDRRKVTPTGRWTGSLQTPVLPFAYGTIILGDPSETSNEGLYYKDSKTSGHLREHGLEQRLMPAIQLVTKMLAPPVHKSKRLASSWKAQTTKNFTVYQASVIHTRPG